MNHYQDSEPPTRFGEVYRPALAAAPNIVVWLHANCTGLVALEGGNAVERVDAACLTGSRFAVQARFYVLAIGGIENARLLLLSGGDTATAVGNRHDLVGRYYADHPGVLQTAHLLFTGSKDALRLFNNHHIGDVTTRRFLGVSAEAQRRERIANCGIGMHPRNPPKGVHSAMHLRDRISDGEWPDDIITHLGRILADVDEVAEAVYRQVIHHQPPVYSTVFWSETPPVADSRVTLSDERDALGQRRVVVDWRIPDEFQHTYTRMHEMLAEDIGQSGLGRMQMLISGEEALASIIASHHHMGTTRMSSDPTRGVVDQNCRVHGVDNLFVAGSSVYPAYGHANPTLTIVALATRLADHLRDKLDK
jgi:choline dehydrogenase-like flavoprotein